MAQSSGPISQGTTAERQFTDVMWRDLLGDEPGVVGDTDGTAYAIALSTSSDVVSVGSATIRSVARVAGFVHAIPVGSPEGITIPAASGTARTDIIALRYDPAFTGLPGPVRLTRIAGTSTSLPAYDAAPPGVEDLPLWSITRQPGQALSQATTARLFARIAPALDVPSSVPLPTSSPLGTVAQYGRQVFRRELGSAGVPVWVVVSDGLPTVEYGTTALDGTAVPSTARRVRVRRSFTTAVANTGGGFNVALGFTFTKLMAVALWPGDTTAEAGLSLGSIVPLVANHTLSTAHGVARHPDGSLVANGTTIRVEVDAVGYV